MRTSILILLLAGAVATTTSAQLSLTWWTVDGGGGTSASADGRFNLSGTAGQPDAGAMVGEGLVLQGGFWNSALAPVPSLWIARLPSGDIEVSWPVWASGFVLEQTATLVGPPGRWSEVSPATYQTDGTRFFVTVPAPADTQFYRLRGVCLGP
jgi:hypothetical protein